MIDIKCSINIIELVMDTKIDGRVEVILGPMFSGKSSLLIAKIRRYKLAKLKCLTINYAKDKRYNKDDKPKIITHDGIELDALDASKLSDIDETLIKGVKVIGINEAQFFIDIEQFVEAHQDKIIILCGLDSTWEMKPFPWLSVISKADSVVKLLAVCMCCGADAPFTKRISDDKELEVIGGADKYMAVCRKCFHHSGDRCK